MRSAFYCSVGNASHTCHSSDLAIPDIPVTLVIQVISVILVTLAITVIPATLVITVIPVIILIHVILVNHPWVIKSQLRTSLVIKSLRQSLILLF